MKKLAKSTSIVAALTTSFTLMGCAASGGQTANVQTVDTVQQCSVRMARLDFFSSATQWQNWQQKHMPQWRVQVPNGNLLLVGLGVRPTPGYGLTLAESSFENNALKINAIGTGPDKGRVMAQVITTPCVLLALPHGNYQSVELHISGDRAQTLTTAR